MPKTKLTNKPLKRLNFSATKAGLTLKKKKEKLIRKTYIVSAKGTADLYALAYGLQVPFLNQWIREDIFLDFLCRPEHQRIIRRFRKECPKLYQKFLDSAQIKSERA